MQTFYWKASLIFKWKRETQLIRSFLFVCFLKSNTKTKQETKAKSISTSAFHSGDISSEENIKSKKNNCFVNCRKDACLINSVYSIYFLISKMPRPTSHILETNIRPYSELPG